MAFRPYCPKCGSLNIVLDKDRAGGWGNPQVMLRCVCGKVYYGEENIRTMHAAQLKAWKADKTSREADQTAEAERAEVVKQQIQSNQTQREHTQQLRRQAEASREQKRLANLAWAKEAARKRGEPETPKPASRSPLLITEPTCLLITEQVTCAWTPCENTPAAKSKYCAVACKNKNARHRYRQRKAAAK